MTKPGKFNKLRVMRIVEHGAYLDGDVMGDILLPRRYLPDGLQEEDEIEVFVSFDSEDRIIATIEKPSLEVGTFAYLPVVSVTSHGAFLNWNMPKDLFVPFREQGKRMEVGEKHIVTMYFDDESRRLVASSKLNRFLDNTYPKYENGDEVDLLVAAITDLGFKAIINNEHWGILYKNEVFQELTIGQRTKGFIKKIRTDDKIDLSLHKQGQEKLEDYSTIILQRLKEQGGTLPLSDKSDSADIYDMFGISKKSFKKAIGWLFRERLITIGEKQITLTEKGSKEE